MFRQQFEDCVLGDVRQDIVVQFWGYYSVVDYEEYIYSVYFLNVFEFMVVQLYDLIVVFFICQFGRKKRSGVIVGDFGFFCIVLYGCMGELFVCYQVYWFGVVRAYRLGENDKLVSCRWFYFDEFICSKYIRVDVKCIVFLWWDLVVIQVDQCMKSFKKQCFGDFGYVYVVG